MSFPTGAAPSLSNWQVQFNGLTMGLGTPYLFTKIEGLDFPAVRKGDVSRALELGELQGVDLLAGRDVTLTGDFVTDGASLAHAQQALATAFVPALSEQPLWLQLPNWPTLATMVRPRRFSTPIDVTWSFGLAHFVIGLHATDPRLYTAAQTITIADKSQGTMINTGNVDTRPLLTLNGPITTPVIQSTTGWTLTIANPGQGTGLTLNSGDTLTIDLDFHIVQYTPSGGQATNARNWIKAGAVWPSTLAGIDGLAPGSNTISLSSADSTASGSAVVTWASAYVL
jgi:hypothetical protein